MINLIWEYPLISFCVISFFILIWWIGIYKQYKDDNPHSKVWITFVWIIITLIISIPTIIISLSQTNIYYSTLIENQKQTTIEKTKICENFSPNIYTSDFEISKSDIYYLSFNITNPTDIWLLVNLDISRYSWFKNINAYLPPKKTIRKYVWLNTINDGFSPNNRVYYLTWSVKIINDLSLNWLKDIECLKNIENDFQYSKLIYLIQIEWINKTLSYVYWEKTCEEENESLNEKENKINIDLLDKNKNILSSKYLWNNGFICNKK